MGVTGSSGFARIWGHVTSTWYSAEETILKASMSNESWINMILWYYLVGLLSYCIYVSGSKWYVDDSPHLNKNILTSFWWIIFYLFLKGTWPVLILLHGTWPLRNFDSLYFCEQARWVKTVKVSCWVAKPGRDQTVGSELTTLGRYRLGHLSVL